jgi:hypothetical protein
VVAGSNPVSPTQRFCSDHFMCKTTILGHQSHHRRRLGRSADTPSARAGGVLNQKQRSQPTPVAVAGAATDM